MTDPITPATIARLRELIAAATPLPWCCCDFGHLECREIGDIGNIELHAPTSPFTRAESKDDAALIVEAVNVLPAHLDQLTAQAAEIERMKREREALVNAAMRGQRLLHVDMLGRWGDLRDAVLHGLDGLDNDQTNAVLGCIDDHFPSDIKPAVAEDSSATENHAARADDRAAELEALLREIRDSYHDNRAGGWPGAGDMFADAICRIDAVLSKREGGR